MSASPTSQASPDIQHEVPLSALNSFGVACTAGELCCLRSELALPAAWQWLRRHPGSLILGSGSNVLLATDRVPAALHVQLAGRRIASTHGNRVIIEIGAGEHWHSLVTWSLANRLWGLENLSLIPGTVGAAPVQNIGAYGVELHERFESLQAMDTSSGVVREFDLTECDFSYRNSLFKTQPGRWLITRVRLRLSRQPELRLDYGAIRDELSRRTIESPTPIDVSEAVCAIRRSKLPDPARLGNAGSFFKNPVVTAAKAEQLRARFAHLPAWPAENAKDSNSVKLSAGWMIEQAGLKGYRQSDAAVHQHHALVLVNHGQATGAQLLSLAHHIQYQIADKFGIALEPEPVIWAAR